MSTWPPARGAGRRRVLQAAAVAALAIGATRRVAAQASVLRLLVPYPVGGGTDVLARSIAAELSAALGASVIVENRPGASGTIGAEAVASSPPDGRTVLFTALIPTHHWYGKPESAQNLLPIFFAARAPYLVVVHPQVQVRTLRELVAMSQEKPQSVSIGSPGSASPPHIAAEVFRKVAKTDFLVVPYKGAGPVIQDLTAGHIHVAFMTAGAVESLVSSGKLRAVAVTSRERMATQPTVPTVAEAGFADFEISNSYGAFLPPGSPPDTMRTLNAAFNRAIRAPEVLTRMAQQGYEPVGGTPEDHLVAMRRDMRRIGALVADGTLKFD